MLHIFTTSGIYPCPSIRKKPVEKNCRRKVKSLHFNTIFLFHLCGVMRRDSPSMNSDWSRPQLSQTFVLNKTTQFWSPYENLQLAFNARGSTRWRPLVQWGLGPAHCNLRSSWRAAETDRPRGFTDGQPTIFKPAKLVRWKESRQSGKIETDGKKNEWLERMIIAVND